MDDGQAGQPGRGATFTIHLPLTAATLVTSSVPEASPPAADQEATVLLVEDNEAVRAVTQDFLTLLGYRVLAAADGPAALAVYEQQLQAIDLMLSDLVMPAMGGLELYHALKVQDPQIRMLVVTGYLPENGGRKLLEAGIAG